MSSDCYCGDPSYGAENYNTKIEFLMKKVLQINNFINQRQKAMAIASIKNFYSKKFNNYR